MILKDKVVVVAGGAGLLGQAFVRGIAERGGTAVVADLDIVKASIVSGSIATAGLGQAIPVQLDITSGVSIDAVIAGVHDKCGQIGAVVNCAYPRNAAYGNRLEDVTYADFCANISHHLGGYFLAAQRFARYFRSGGNGNIVNLASIYGAIPPRFELYAGTQMTMPVEYAAIKAGVIQLTRYFAQYYKKDGIRVNCISPGGIFNGQPEPFVRNYAAWAGTKGMLAAEDVMGTLAFLLSDESRHVTGQNVIVDDGFSL